MRIVGVTGCDPTCSPGGGTVVTVALENVFAWDVAPIVAVRGERCGGGSGVVESPCQYVEHDWNALRPTVACRLPAGPAGTRIDLVVTVDTKIAEWIQQLSYAGCPAGQHLAAGGLCQVCKARS